MRSLSLSHLTVLEVGPPDLITLAADAGFSSVGIRLNSPMPGGIAYPLQDGGEIAETRRRMADRDVEVLDVEVVRLGPETLVASYAADVRYRGGTWCQTCRRQHRRSRSCAFHRSFRRGVRSRRRSELERRSRVHDLEARRETRGCRRNRHDGRQAEWRDSDRCVASHPLRRKRGGRRGAHATADRLHPALRCTDAIAGIVGHHRRGTGKPAAAGRGRVAAP